ncbi:MAG TPA: Gfo/Idh/MocA family oxidoreductase, partial [Thermomicrobiales bacterium]|nr:Gfo/Idh/MocA family oxidoreductase [Thermomicrobiales bacterium]
MTDTLRVAVLGAGRWAQTAHIPGWQRDPRCEIVVICDPAEDRARDFAHEFGIPAHSRDWQAVVGRDDIDIVDVATPSRTHFELAWAAL